MSLYCGYDRTFQKSLENHPPGWAETGIRAGNQYGKCRISISQLENRHLDTNQPNNRHSEDSGSKALEQRIHAGDSDALASAFEVHRDRLRQIVLARLDSKLKGRVDPSDVLQEAFIDMAKRLPNFSKRTEPMSVFVWMRLVATESIVNTHRKHLAAGKRDARKEQPLQVYNGNATSICLAENMLARYSSAGNKALRRELKTILMDTLRTMDSIDQEIILMRTFEDLTNVEAAEALGLSQRGASNRYIRALARLHSSLESIPGFLN